MLNNPAYPSPMKDAASARKYLVEYSLLMLDQDPNHLSLSGSLLHLSFVTAADTIRLIVILIESMAQPELTPSVSEAQVTLMEKVHLLAEHVKELKKVKDDGDSLEVVITYTFDIMKEDLQATTQWLNEAAESLLSAMLETTQPDLTPSPVHGNFYTDILKKSSYTVEVAHHRPEPFV